MGGPGAGGVINTLRIRRVAQRLGQGAANYSDALSQTAAARGRGDAGGERATGGRVGGRRLSVLRMRVRPNGGAARASRHRLRSRRGSSDNFSRWMPSMRRLFGRWTNLADL